VRRELCDEIAVVTCERLHLSSPLRFRADVCVTHRHSLCVLYTVGFVMQEAWSAVTAIGRTRPVCDYKILDYAEGIKAFGIEA